MAKRIITGLILAAIGAGAYLIRLFFAPVYFEVFLWAVTAVCAYEVATVMGERTLPCQKWIAIIISSLLPSRVRPGTYPEREADTQTAWDDVLGGGTV